ncbi:hypothetical protein ACIQNI_24665 [Streptomyces sp. NPDC091266]|uniref:hypothetical protein n=1 Tax=Streptomyces sp. NPDC091266 TaxID=3365978 RepID=UPI0038196002
MVENGSLLAEPVAEIGSLPDGPVADIGPVAEIEAAVDVGSCGRIGSGVRIGSVGGIEPSAAIEVAAEAELAGGAGLVAGIGPGTEGGCNAYSPASRSCSGPPAVSPPSAPTGAVFVRSTPPPRLVLVPDAITPPPKPPVPPVPPS